MRKKMINGSYQKQETLINNNWLNIENIAEVEITSENERHPIESALILDSSSGWVAGEEGMQTIRIVFNTPQNIQKVMLKFSNYHMSVHKNMFLIGIQKMVNHTK